MIQLKGQKIIVLRTNHHFYNNSTNILIYDHSSYIFLHFQSNKEILRPVERQLGATQIQSVAPSNNI